MSVPQTMYLPLKAPSGRSHHATIRQVPDLPIQAVSCSMLDAGLDLLLERRRTSSTSSGGATRSQNFAPIDSSSV